MVQCLRQSEKIPKEGMSEVITGRCAVYHRGRGEHSRCGEQRPWGGRPARSGDRCEQIR